MPMEARVASKYPRVRAALSFAGGSVDEALVRLMLAASRGKGRRKRELAERMAYYDGMAAEYAAIDSAHFYAAPPPLEHAVEREVRRAGDGRVVDLSWASGYVPRLASARSSFMAHAENATAHARVFLHAKPAPAVVCIAGYRSGPMAFEEQAWRASWLFERGLDVAVYVLPFHGPRAPRRFARAPLFPSQGNIARTNEGFGQVVWEVRSLSSWFRARGASSIGVAGMSMGGYAAALVATVEASLDYGVLFVPLADITDAVVSHEAMRGLSIDPDLVAASRRALAIHRPLLRAPALSGDRMLVVSAEGDRITGRTHADRLAAHFDAKIASFAGAHILQFGRKEGFEAMERLIVERGVVADRSTPRPNGS
jgi:dienelactone hydrolase